MSLEEHRIKIDAIDTEIIRLLNERADIVHEIGVIKKRDGLEIYAPEREEKLLRRLVRKGEGGRLPDVSIRAIYREIMSAALALEEDLKIAYLGPVGTWTHQAAIRKFGHSVKYLPQSSFGDVFEQVGSRLADYGVIPIENSTEGAVRDMFQLFVKHPLKICADISLPIQICLMAREKGGTIRRVFGHPTNLAAARRWLARELPGRELLEVANSAEAAAEALADPDAAAIGTHIAAEINGLKLVATGIEDEATTARFSVVGRRASLPTGNDLTLMTVSGAEIGNTLSEALRLLEAAGVETIRVDAHEVDRTDPAAPDQRVLVRLEIVGHAEVAPVADAISELRRSGRIVTVFGSYPQPMVDRADGN